MVFHDEFELIQMVKHSLGKPSRRVELGIGDDAAVVTPPQKKMVATMDTLVEGVHFDLSYTTPRELGHKALAVNLSDIAAMAATPLYALISLGLKQDVSEHFVDELYVGLKKLAKEFDVDVIGGNTVQSPNGVIADLVVIGEAPQGYVTRGGAREGDIVAVTGYLGTSAAGLNCLKRLGRDATEKKKELIRAHLCPLPRLREAEALRKVNAITSLIDISDGVASEVHHLAKSSGVGMLIEEKSLPIHPACVWAAREIGSNARLWALYGGEDYELLCTISPRSWTKAERALSKLGTKLTRIGEVRAAREKIILKTTSNESHPLAPRGWNHFVRRRVPDHR